MHPRFFYRKRSCQTFLLCILLLFSNNLCAQHKISLSFKDKPLRAVLKEITTQTGYTFVYSDAFAQMDKKVTVALDAPNASIDVILKAVLKDQTISYEIKDNQIMLAPSNIVINKSSNTQRKIKGIVSDENGSPLPGVSILNKTKQQFSASDLDGQYTIDASDGDILVFSSIGMIEKSLPVMAGKSAYNIELASDLIALEDVVITGYQTLSKERATGSFDVIKAEELEKPATDIGQRLIGSTAGVASKVDVNGNVIFEIRGRTSLETSAQPLVVVDGFAIEGGLNTLNPNDIENITILKDAAAASIWGAKSANGVIVVTSKSNKGKDNDLKVEFNAFWKFSPKMNMGYISPKASSAETVEYEQMGFNTRFFGGFTYPKEDGNGYNELYGYYTGVVQTLNEVRLGYLTEGDAQKILNNYRNFDNSRQIKDHILANPFTQQYNLSVMGSTKKTDNVLSLMYEGAGTNLQGDHKDRYLVNFRNTSRLYKWLDFNFSGSFGFTGSKNNSIPYDWSPYQRLIEEDGSFTNVPEMFYMPNLERHVPMSSFPYSDWTYNPIREREYRDFRTKELSYRGQLGLTFKIIEGLSISSKFQYEGQNISSKNIYSENSFAVRSAVNESSTWDRKTGEITPNLPKGGFLDQKQTDIWSYNWRNQITFSRDLGKRHNINVIAGMEISRREINAVENPRVYGYDNNRLTVGGFPNGPTLTTDWMGYDQNFNYTHSFASSCDEFFSMYANAAYTYHNKYSVSVSARTDASNLITDDPKYRYSPFLSFGASWNIGRENFIKNIKWIDRLALRATYGSNGNVDKSTSFLPLIAIGNVQDSYINGYLSEISSYGNPNLRWEKTHTLDIGIDYDLLGGQLYGKIDYYNKVGKDLIVEMNIPSVFGTKKQMLNKAKMLNTGVELSVGTTQKIYGSHIVWRGNFNFSYNYNKVQELYRSSYTVQELTYMKTGEYLSAPWAKKTGSYVQGYDASALWSFKYAGMKDFGTSGKEDMQPTYLGKDNQQYNLSRFPPGDARNYLYEMGTTVAPYNIGFTSSFKIYDFDLSFTITGKFGHVFNALSFNYPAMTGGNAMPNKVYEEVKNANPMEMIPMPFGKSEPRYYFWDRFYPYMDYLVQSANHIRFQELNITYNVPGNFIRKIGLSSAKLYAQGNNLFVITANKYNEDPEYPMGTYRPQAAFTFGLNINF